MNAYASIEVLSNTATTQSGRAVMQAIVELFSYSGDWLGSFLAFGLDLTRLNSAAYFEADRNLSSKGYNLQYVRASND